jgi:large subunit ribosomal protein L9
MEIILLKDVEKVGRKGEIVSVRDGFGRNFLLPRTLALPATPENRAQLETEKRRAAERRTQKKQEAEKLAEKLASLRLRVPVAVGEKDKLFGSVTSQDVAEAAAREGITLDKKQLILSEPIRSLGTHAVIVELDPNVKTTLQVEVVKKS